MIFIFPRRLNVLSDLFTFAAQHNAGPEQVSTGNSTQNSNVAFINSLNVVFNHRGIQSSTYCFKCRKD